ncbi:hypothetical protein [Paraburkholderia graminis]|uniref:Uncharacterized protein n=1 Tax=Paraburkholderia graminis TaxID=60548 RepID=A0ABD5CNS4_9BURK|nr:hypothetical protein [Paraburkholderia graminis]MDR6206974.1 hypothetical protein [Paraburkholderia graminis]
MSKFKIKMKLTGFELEIEGSQDNVPEISQAIGRQLAGLMQTPDALLNSAADVRTLPAVLPAEEVRLEAPTRRRQNRKRKPTNGNGLDDEASEVAVDWRHEPSKYGTPSQNWTTGMKALWLLYVVGQETSTKELSGRRIALSFNRHFRQAKEITVANVNRDLGRAKVKAPVLVGEDATKSPSAWYLTEEGIKAVQSQIATALGRA